MTATPTPPLQVTIKQAGDMLGYSERKMYAMLQRGEIRGIGRGRGLRIPISELERWQKEQLHEQAPEQPRGNNLRIARR